MNTGAIVEVSNRNNTIEVQTFKCWMFNGVLITCVRLFDGSVWQPWEWVNPPMELGVEYRTTERYEGKPVYVRLINFGALPNASKKTIAAPDNLKTSISYDIISTTGALLTGYDAISSFACSDGVIAIKTVVDESNTNVHVRLAYTKTTD